MEFFIKKNATLPVLKLQVVKDGRNDFNNFMKTIELSSIFFSMIDVESGVPKISSRPGGFVEKTFIEPNAEPEYYIYYQFQNRDTNKVGRYEAQFMLRTDDGVLILPIREKLFVNVQESFVADDLPYESCYTSEFPCCQPNGITTTTTTCNCPTCPPCPSPTPTPEPVTTTTTFDPTTTTTTFEPTTTTTTFEPITTTTTTIPLETILDVNIIPGSIVIDYNFSANQYVTEELQINFTHNLGTYTGNPITIITGITIPIGEISGNTQIILNDDFNNLSREDSFGDITSVPPSLNWVIYENYPTPTPTPTPTQTSTPTQTPIPTCIDGWMTENFSGTTYRNGDPILQATNSTEWSEANNNQTGAWCYYNFDSNNGPIYGKLYNWFVVGDIRGIGNEGYIVPSESDWDTLEVCLGGNSIAGGKLKTTGTLQDNDGLWNRPNVGATNESGFSGLPSGVISDGGFSSFLNSRGSFWTSTEIGVGVSMVMNLNNGRTDVYHGPDTKGKGYSIRLKQGIPLTPTPTPTITPTTSETPTPTPTETLTPTPTVTPTMTPTPLPITGPLSLTFEDISYADLLVGDSSNVNDWNTFFDLPNYGTPFSSVDVSGNTVNLTSNGYISLRNDIFINYYHLVSINDGGLINSVNGRCFLGCNLLTSIVLPNLTTINGELNFTNMMLINNLDFPNLKVINGNNTFESNFNLTGFTAPNLININGQSSFRNCDLLTVIELPKLIYLKSFSFVYCDNLSSVILPLVESIGIGCFFSATSLTLIDIPSCLFLGNSVDDNTVFNHIVGNTIVLNVNPTLLTCNNGNPDGDIQYLQNNNTVIINPTPTPTPTPTMS